MVASPIVISYSLSKSPPGERAFDHRLVMTALGLTLVMSPLGQVFLPRGLGAVPNLAIALATMALAFVAFKHLRPLPAAFRTLARLSVALLLCCLLYTSDAADE